jgi:hypothetical protein
MRSSFIHFVIVCLLTGVVIGGYGVGYAAVSNKSAEAVDLQNQIVAANTNVRSIAVARAALSDISADEATMQNYFVSDTDVVPFIDTLEAQGLAHKAPVTVLSVATGGSAAQPSLVVALSVKGTFDAVMRTVGAIEYAPYAMSIKAFSVAQDTKNNWHAELTLIVDSPTAPVGTTPS